MKIMEEVITMLDSCAKRKKFEKICKMPQAHLKKYLAKELEKTHKEITIDDGFVYAQGTFPVLLVAHMDTVHKHLPQKFVYSKDKNIVSDPNGIGGDDRCGVYMILEVVKRFNCSVLFCEDEEVGGIGADKFIETKLAASLDFNYLIEFDRRGSKDAVFYDCDNPKFTEFICKDFYKEDWGSFSDIATIAPFFGVAAVNLSCGYYKAHTKDEYVVLSEMERSIEEACKILERTTEADVFEYIPAKNRWGYGSNYAGYYSGYGSGNYGTAWYDDDDF
jgi:di/tripeptidase